jgi:hypothetical protein
VRSLLHALMRIARALYAGAASVYSCSASQTDVRHANALTNKRFVYVHITCKGLWF